MSRAPFQFFTDFHGELADAVREGRRREFASFTRFGGEDIPDPNARETFERSRVPPTGDDSFYRALLKLRHDTIVPRLPGARTIDSEGARRRRRAGALADGRWRGPRHRRQSRRRACSLGRPARQAALRQPPTSALDGDTARRPQHRRLPRARAMNDEAILAARPRGRHRGRLDRCQRPAAARVRRLAAAHPRRARRLRAAADRRRW